ncbi:Gp15 family bacteriophage protein, partial [Bacillus cereus]|uniref:Gp15 family bacteriophage protein n=1 Tax=Bacillus cereus TaxID=1396 RepID=UPI001965156C
SVEVHWWLFRVLLHGLPEGTAVRQAISDRQIDETGMTPKMKANIKKLNESLSIVKVKRAATLEDHYL